MWLKDRVVLITGGSRGIGRATALRLAEEGPAHIALVYVLNHDAAEAAVLAIEQKGISASAICADVGQEEELQRVFNVMQERHGRVDVFISNAARASFGPLLEMSARTWQKVGDLNAKAFLLGAQMAVRIMPDGGRIIALSSLGGRFYLPDYGALGAAKAAMESLVRYLAVELAPRNIHVNAVCGGFVDTDSTRLLENFNSIAIDVAARTPAGRIAQPEDIAGVVALLCRGDADWIQGQTIVADGGYSLRG
jgi:enoyl-[acyl-carrier protein] reductase III